MPGPVFREHVTGSLSEYWDLTYEGNDIYGELFDYRYSEEEVGNVLYSYLLTDPCAGTQDGQMSELEFEIGSTVAGTLGPETGYIEISGMTADLKRDFSITIDLVRVQ